MIAGETMIQISIFASIILLACTRFDRLPNLSFLSGSTVVIRLHGSHTGSQTLTTDETRAPVALTVAEALSKTLPAVHVSAFSRSILPSKFFFKMCT